MNSQSTKALLQKINIIIFRFVIIPILLWGLLSIPELYYASNYSEILKEFNKSFINHNFQFVFILIGGLAWIIFLKTKFFLSKFAKAIEVLVLLFPLFSVYEIQTLFS